MEWVGDGIVLGAKRHGEENVILELMTRERGRHLGMLRRGAAPALRPVIQPGNTVSATWRARLEDHMGAYTVETRISRVARIIDQASSLNAMALLAEHMRLLAERDPHPALYDALSVVLDSLDQPHLAAALIIRFEVALLEELGFGLDLLECAATGRRDDLTHVSPKSGRAVCSEAAAPYRDRLFALPGFLSQDRLSGDASASDIAAGFRLTGYFLARHVWEPRGRLEPVARGTFVSLVA